MFKIKCGGIARNINKFDVSDLSPTGLRVFFVLDGNVLVNDENITAGEGFSLSYGTEVIPVPSNASFVWCDLVGKGIGDYSGFAFSDIANFEKIAEALLCGGDLESRNNSFLEAAAKLLLSFAESTSADNGKESNKYVDMAKRYIETNYHLPIKVEEIAIAIGADRKYLRNLFFTYMGMSTKDYLMQVRIQKAKELLESGEYTVGEVSEAVGYTDALGFSKIFKKYVGVSPSELRGSREFVKKAVTKKKAVKKTVNKKTDEPKTEVTPAPEKHERKREDIKYFLL